LNATFLPFLLYRFLSLGFEGAAVANVVSYVTEIECYKENMLDVKSVGVDRI
jgi:Na+-driven multidrug efflux pump